MLAILILLLSSFDSFAENRWWYIDNNGEEVTNYLPAKRGVDIGLNRLHDLVPRNHQRVIVAVIDSGVNQAHPFYKSALYYPSNYPRGVSLRGDNDITDGLGHGTHIAGIIHHITKGRAQILPIKVIDENGRGNAFNLFEGIRKAIDLGANIINLSLDNPEAHPELIELIKEGLSKDIVFVTVAGNFGQNNDVFPNYPSSLSFENILSVASLTPSGQIERYSNFGKKSVDIAAPGEKIYSSGIAGDMIFMSGTSMASAVAAGSLALLKILLPDQSYIDLSDRLKKYSFKTPYLKERVSSGGRINLTQAYYQRREQEKKIRGRWIKIPLDRNNFTSKNKISSLSIFKAPDEALAVRLIFKSIKLADVEDQLCLKTKELGYFQCLSGEDKKFMKSLAVKGNKIYLDLTTGSHPDLAGYEVIGLEYILPKKRQRIGPPGKLFIYRH